MIRLSRPSIDDEDVRAVADVLKTGYLVQGPTVRRFEQVFCEMSGAKNAVALSNCTAALHLALVALELEPGARVVTTPYSWPATANAVVLAGAEPVFVDLDPVTFNLSPEKLGDILKAQKNIRAILPVHTFGNMADMVTISSIAERHGVPVIEDAACALGARQDGIHAGNWGKIGCFSFHPRKAITTGEGGMLVTSDEAVAKRVRALRNHGLDPDAAEPTFLEAGYNLRLTEIQAALGVTQLAKFPRILSARREQAARYDVLFAGSGFVTPRALPNAPHTYQTYVVLVPEEAKSRRNALIAALKRREVEVTIGTHHIPLTKYYREKFGYSPGDFPVADDVAARAISVPLHETLTAAEQEEVVAAAKEELARAL